MNIKTPPDCVSSSWRLGIYMIKRIAFFFLVWINYHVFYFLWNLLGWHRFIRLCKFQGYNITIHNLHITLCAHHLKFSLLPSHICTPFPSSTSHHPFPLVATTLFSFREVFICLSCSFICCFLFHSLNSYDSSPFSSNLFYLTWCSQVPSMSQMAAFHLFVWLGSVPLYV